MAKDFMAKHGIPTAQFRNFSNYEEAKIYLEDVQHDVVIKATGLAAGKGVIIPASREEAQEALKNIMLVKEFGSAGNEVVIEEYLVGDELSFLTFSDGFTIRSLPAAQDHKQIFEGDKGPNTGGMGAYAPAPIAKPALVNEIHKTALQLTIDAMRRHEGHPFVGLLFTGFMITKDGPRVLEYNVRFGDPETQTLLPLIALETDLAEIIVACTEGRLDSVDISMSPGSSATIIAAARGYPGAYEKGETIELDVSQALGAEDHIFHAGTSVSDGLLKTNGGRVIAATSTADSLEKALQRAYAIMSSINWPGKYHRTDIGHRALHDKGTGGASGDGLTYASAGVSISAGNELVRRIKPLASATKRAGASASLGGFGGSFDLAEAGYEGAPRLVTGTDGVGTKLKIAQAVRKHDTIGIDLVAMNVNDLIVQGAEPLFFTDVYSCETLDVDIAYEVVKGVCVGCRDALCALIGGETAEMSDLFRPGTYDLVGTATGAIARGRRELPDIDAMREGDIVIGLTSSGCHSNGFTLIRRIVEQSHLSYASPAPWDNALNVGESLLTPTKIYVKSILKLVEKDLVKGMAHITGGGLLENVPRMLPNSLAAEIDAVRWECPPVFKWLKNAGKVTHEEFARVFNTGIGMVLIVNAADERQVLDILSTRGESAVAIGILKARTGEGCIVKNMDIWG